MKRILALILPYLLLAAGPAAAGPAVAVSIRPFHSLVSGLMQGITEPELIIGGSGSPHGYHLRPSEVRALQEAELIIWAGPELESFLDKTLATVGPERSLLTLLHDLPQLQLHPVRQGGSWAHAPEDGHDHGAHRQIDPHIWLDPDNAAVIVGETARRLAALDPARREIYEANRDTLLERLRTLDRDLSLRLAPLKEINYIVFHDAYQYFERHFGLHPVGALAVDPDRRPGARRLRELRQAVREHDVACVFSEPQFEPQLVKVLIEGSEIRTGLLDPLGSKLSAGPDLYFDLMQEMADALQQCLDPK